METFELPLVFFTVLSQAAVGALILTTLFEPFVARSDTGTRRGLNLVGTLVFPTLALALALSLLHLGQPLAAFRALGHVTVSWLSREIWAFGLLLALTAGYSYLSWTDRAPSLRRWLGVVAAVVGVVGVVASAMTYAIPARPVWTPLLNTLSFFGTALLLGGLVVAAAVRVVGGQESSVGRILVSSGAAAALGLLIAVGPLTGVAIQSQTDATVLQSIQVAIGTWLFWFRLAIGLAVPFAIVAGLVFQNRQVTARYAVLGVVAAFAGELAGRAVFYTAAMSPSLWG